MSVDNEADKSRVVLVAALYMNPGRRAEFDEFETAAARIMRRYGGVIERRMGMAPADENQPDEVHVVVFPIVQHSSATGRIQNCRDWVSCGRRRFG